MHWIFLYVVTGVILAGALGPDHRHLVWSWGPLAAICLIFVAEIVCVAFFVFLGVGAGAVWVWIVEKRWRDRTLENPRRD